MDNLSAALLDPLATYCVVTDSQARESMLVSGRQVQSECELKRYCASDGIGAGYVAVDCGDFLLAVWRDPTRPELSVATAKAIAAPTVDPDLEPEERALPPETDRWSLAVAIASAAARLAQSLYVQS